MPISYKKFIWNRIESVKVILFFLNIKLSLDKLTSKIEKILEQFDIKRILMEVIALVKDVLGIKMKKIKNRETWHEYEIVNGCAHQFKRVA